MKPPETVAFSSSIRIEQRTQPRVHPNVPIPQRVAQPIPPIPKQSVVKRVVTRHELSVQRPNASPLAQRLAREQQILQRESEQLQAANNPLADVRNANPPATLKHTMFDASGESRDNVEAYLLPIRHWKNGSLSCYYVQYNAQFSSGGNERGVIPWPVCYPQSHDSIAIANAISERTGRSVPLPIPVPQASYVLPTGTYLTPLLKNIYSHHPNS